MTPSPTEKPERPKYDMVENSAALVRTVERLRGVKLLAIDTEFVGEKTYYPSLELIQIADGEGFTAVIDAQRVEDLAPLAEIVCDESVEKILHAGGQDLPILRRALGSAPLPIFDTQLAAAMAGLGAQLSLSNLTQMLVGKRVDKGQTVTDWSRRPLRREQLDYAARDVENLHAMREALAEKLEARGRFKWFHEEQHRRAVDALNPDAVPPEEFHRTVKEWNKLAPRGLAILRELATWRDGEARRNNLPRRFILPDPALIALAQLAPTSVRDIEHVRNVSAGQLKRHEKAVLAAIRRGSELPREEWPRKEPARRADVPTGFVELLQALVRTIAEQEEIASGLLATSSELNALVNNRARAEELSLPVLQGWRRELVGEQLLALLDGRLRVRIADGRRLVFER